MIITDHLKFKTNLTEYDQVTIRQIQDKINRASVTPERIKAYIAPLLDLIQRGLAVDNITFINDVFFDFYVIRTKTEPNLERIYRQLVDIGKHEENSKEDQTHLVNLYRNIVSDAFDPYLSLVVGTLQFIEGTFRSVQLANLSLGERSKYEYAYSRLKPTILFDGYDPTVRNSVSHTGTDGIIYERDKIVFRNIKRGNPPIVSDVVTLTTDKLCEKILQLMDFIVAIDCCIEIVGFDVSDIIKGNSELSAKFFDEILSKAHRLDIHADLEESVQKILNYEGKEYREKILALNYIFSEECKKRNITISGIGFNNEKRSVRIDVPATATDVSSDTEIISKALNLIRYGIVAVLLYKSFYETFLIAEVGTNSLNRISVLVSSKDLEAYAKEEIGLYDILNDGSIYIDDRKIDVTVDFDKLTELEYLSLDRRFPRRQR